MIARTMRIPAVLLLGLLALGCEPLSEQDRADKAAAVATLQSIGEKLPALKAKLEKLIDRGKSIALEVAEIRAKVKAGSFPAGDAVELIAGLLAEKDTISKEIVETKEAIEELLALGKKADEKLEEIRKRNRWAWARTIGEGARATSLVEAEKTRDALVLAIEKHPEAKPTAKAKAEEAGILPALAEVVKRLT
jgi:chromosome segregation ATPase